MFSKIYKILFISIILLITTGCSKNTDYVSKNAFFFNTSISITIYDGNCNQSFDSLITECFNKCKKYENIISKTIPTSDTALINNSVSSVEVSETEATLVKKALHFSKMTGGAFDMTIAPLSEIWNFNNNNFTIPTSSQIENELVKVNHKNISVSNNVITKIVPDTKIDLGGIAKGYIADLLKDYLVQNGVTSALINLGGNIQAIGGKPDKSAFNIGVQRPFFEGEHSFIVNGKNISVVTSGIYERNREIDGKLYHHIIDPKTGYPCDNSILSVTIISEDSTTCDALSTACFVLGIDKGLNLINQLNDVHCVYIDTDYNLHCSDGITIDSENKIYIK